MSVQNLHRINQRITTILLKRGMVVLCTECKHSVTQSWNTTKVFWQFRGIMLTWISEPWKKYIISVSFTFPSVVGKPTSYSRHVPDDIAHTISVRWQTEGITVIICRSRYFDKPITIGVAKLWIVLQITVAMSYDKFYIKFVAKWYIWHRNDHYEMSFR